MGCCSSCRGALSLRHPEPLPARVTSSSSDYSGGIREICSFLPPPPSLSHSSLSPPLPAPTASVSFSLIHLTQDSQAAFKPKPKQDHEPLVTCICLGWCLISLWLTINQFIYSLACSKHPLPREALCVLIIHLKLSFSFFFLLCLL